MNERKKPKALILSCSTGEGHNSAARALKESLQLIDIDSEICDVLDFKSRKTRERISALYDAVIKKTPLLFGAVYKAGAFYDFLKLPTPVYSANAKYAYNLYSYIRENAFGCVICTHLFAMQAMTEVRKKYCICPIKCYGVLTDYTAIPFYRETDLDGYFVSDGRVSDALCKKGIPADKIFCTGIPVSPKFNFQITKEQARRTLNIPCGKKTVVITTGGAGCGKITSLCRKTDKALDGGHFVAVLVGRNKKLADKLIKLFGANEKFRVVGFTPDINLWLKAADVVISKAGGLSSTEAAVSNVALVHLKAIPGQETANMEYFAGNGLSVRADTVKKAVRRTVELLNDEDCRDIICRLQKFIIKADAAQTIVKQISEEMNYDGCIMDCVYNGGISFGKRDVLQNYS